MPDDVFQPGETRPTRPKKKVVKKADAISGQKRTLETIDVSAYKSVKTNHDQRITRHG